MKITLAHSILGGRAGGGGGIRQMLELAYGLQGLGHEVVVCAHNYQPGTITPDPADAFEIRAVETGEFSLPTNAAGARAFSTTAMTALAKLLPDDADVINVHEGPAYFAGADYKTLGGTAPVVWTRNDATQYELALMPDESWLPSTGSLRRSLRRWLARSDREAAEAMDAIVVLDERNKRMVQHAYGREARIIRSGAAQKFFDAPPRAEARERLGIPAEEFAVLAVGILYPYRRHEDVIEAVGMLDPSGRRPHLRVIGSDHLSPQTATALAKRVRDEGLEDRVELITTAVPDSDLVAQFAAADAFVFANELQTWGLAPLESIAAGTPVVVSRGAGVHEVLDGHPGVQLVDTRRPDQIAAALERVRSEPAAFDVGETREWSRRELSAGRFAERMAELFAGLD